jgi:uncharacterized protein YkwD
MSRRIMRVHTAGAHDPLNLRVRPDGNSEVVVQIPHEARVTVLGTPQQVGTQQWVEVSYQEPGQMQPRRGFVNARYLRPEITAPVALPDSQLVDRAPRGSFEQGIPGALDDRDFSATSLDVQRAQALINEYRAIHGLQPVRLDPRLTTAAQVHADDLMRHDRISHFGSDGSTAWDRMVRQIRDLRLGAENVGTGQTSLEEVVRGWIASPGHNRNLLLADATRMGIALARNDAASFRTAWVLTLGRPESDATPLQRPPGFVVDQRRLDEFMLRLRTPVRQGHLTGADHTQVTDVPFLHVEGSGLGTRLAQGITPAASV